MRPEVRIQGDGVAGRCCAHLLSQAGFKVLLAPINRPRLPAIVLSEPAQNLIRETFGLPRGFDDLPRIRRRVVAWGAKREAIPVDHSAVVISEEALLARLQTSPMAEAPSDVPWVIYAAKPLPVDTEEHRFGSRLAVAIPVSLKREAEPETCWMEALAEGWLFLITCAPGAGWLAAAGAQPAQLLDHSSLVRAQIAEAGPVAASFAASPRIAAPLAGDSWLACGTAAMGFDPICGDGTAHAIREGILASAVVKAALRGGEAAELTVHYRDRLTAGFLRHLLHCFEYYSSGHEGPWWEAEAATTKSGIKWCSRRIGDAPQFRYRLRGFDLEPIPKSPS